MVIAYVLLVVLTLVPRCLVAKDGVYKEYLEPRYTIPIKGFFVFVVLLSHFQGYVILPDSMLNSQFYILNKLIGQLMVAIFFFYSGYGLLESVKKKRGYIIDFPRKRILTTWLNYSICIVFYIIFNLITKEEYDLITIVLSFTGWESIGNSNWFIFVTLVLYILFYCAFSIEVQNIRTKLFLFTIFSVALFVILYFVKASYWYNTSLCMAAGMWYSYFKSDIDWVMGNEKSYWGIFIVLFLLFVVTYNKSSLHPINCFFPIVRQVIFCFCSVIFCLLIVTITMKLQIRSYFCYFLGKHVFSIYILQRLFFKGFQPFILNPYLFFACSAITTVFTASLYDYGFNSCIRRYLQ